MNFLKSGISISSQISYPKYLFKESLRRCGKLRGDCEKTISCWNCKEAVDCTKYFFCNKCDHIQPTSEQNLFEYMGLKPVYALDDEALKKRFRDLQFKLHPDKFARSSEVEKNMSDEHSRKLNKAFKTLSEPLSRARYLLQVLGEEETNADLSPEDLMKMMEWNEKVAEMSKQDLERERIVVQNNILQCLSELQKAFSQRLLSEVKQRVTSLSYLYSLRKTIDNKLDASHSS